jgi:hypothetical protein
MFYAPPSRATLASVWLKDLIASMTSRDTDYHDTELLLLSLRTPQLPQQKGVRVGRFAILLRAS